MEKEGNTMKKLWEMIILVGILLMCVGCGAGSSPEKELVGTWEGEQSGEKLVFYEDGSYKAEIGAFQTSGDYKLVSEDEIELTSNAYGLGADMEHVAGIHGFSLEEDKLTIKGGGADGIYHKIK